MTSTSSRFTDFVAAANRARSHVRQGDAWVAKYTRDADLQSPARVRTHYGSQKVTVAAMQMAEKKVWAHRS